MATTFRSNFRRRFKRAFTQKNYDWKLLGVVIFMCLAGLAFLASALPHKYTISVLEVTTFKHEFFKQLIFGFWIGGFLAYILARVDYHVLLEKKKVIIAIAVGALLLIFIPMTLADIWALLSGQNSVAVRESWAESSKVLYTANNTVRWIKIPGVTNIQPSELAKIALLIYFAGYLNIYEKFSWYNFKKPLYVFGFSALAIVLQPDLGNVVVISMILLTALWINKVPTKFFATILSVLLIFGLFFTLTTDYRRKRVETWVAQTFCQEKSEGMICSNFQAHEIDKDDTLQIDRIKNAIASGGAFGVGYGKSDLKKDIPEVTTDGIIGVIGAEMGFVFTIFFLSLYLYIFWRGMKIARNAPDRGGKALAAGISIWIVFQAFWNVAGMIGVLPMKGLPLPFVSEGGTAILINLTSIGILLNISSQTVPDSKKPKLKVKRKKFNYY